MKYKIHNSKYCLRLIVAFICVFAIISHHYLYKVIRFDFDSSLQPPTIYPYMALIIDDRATPKLVTAVLNVLQHIPADWKVQIFTHLSNWPFYKRSALSPFITNKRVFTTRIDFSRNNMSGEDFINLCLTSPLLWRRVHGDRVFYFQIDSVICSNSPYKLTDFLHYDYIGAPWHDGGCCNGGFSIRSRTIILRMLATNC